MPRLRAPAILIGVTLIIAAGLLIYLLRQIVEQENEHEALQARIVELQGYVAGVQQLTTAVLDAESAQRGYLLTEDHNFLKAFENALEATQAARERVADYGSRHVEEARRAAAIGKRADDKIDSMATTLQMIARGERDAAVRTVVLQYGKRAMDELHMAEADLLEDAGERVAAHLAEAQAKRRTRNQIALAFAIVAFAAGGLGVALLIRTWRLSERQAAALETANRRLVLLADALPGLVSYLGPDGRFQFLNRCYREWFDVEPDAFIGRTPVELTGEAAGSVYMAWIAEAARGQALVRENDAPFERGRPRPVRSYLVPDRGADGTVRGVVSLTLDISGEREAMRALEAARDHALEASRAKSRFIAAASHDLRQPLYALTLFASALERRVQQENLRELVQNIQQSARTMQSMFSALLDISKLDAGVMTPKVSSFPVESLLAKLETEFGERARARGLDFRVQRCGAMIRTDPDLIESILRNLVSNAVKFTAQGRIVLGCRRNGPGTLRLEVHDTGPGMPPEQMERMFQEFAQGDARVQTGETGLGLGLAIVRRLSDLLGLTIIARSKPGRGSAFGIAVPLAEAEPAGRHRPAEAAPERVVDLRHRRVLVIEDEPEVRAGLVRLLGDWGMVVTEASDAAEAEARLREALPDLILADFNLGEGATGLDVIQALQARHGRKLPALVVTGATGPATLVTLKAGGIAWAAKPLEPATLRRRIADLLASAD